MANKIALLIGVSEYASGLNSLPAALGDVKAMQQVLQNPRIGDFSEVQALQNPDPLEMQSAIEDLFCTCSKNDLVLLFFSGHGIKDDAGKLYFATCLTRKNHQGQLARSTAVPASFVHEMMNNSRSRRQVVILDCCFSGAFATNWIAKDSGVIDVASELGGEGRVILTSSTSTQYSFEQQQSDLSIYTQYLVEGIATGAADLDRDDLISIDELHEYARSRVQEVAPMMKPEIYAARGFKIVLAKAPTVDPQLRYRKEVELIAVRGEISSVGRHTLRILQAKLGLAAETAAAIETAVLTPLQQEFQQKLQQYRQVLMELAEQEFPPSAETRQQLSHLQRVLGLRDADAQAIEAQVQEDLDTYQRNLLHYEVAFSQAVKQEYPLNRHTRQTLQQLQQRLGLRLEDTAAVAARLTAEVEAYRSNLQHYEQALTEATQQCYPLPEAVRGQLQQLTQRLALRAADVEAIETRILGPLEDLRQKRHEYEQVFLEAIQQEYPLPEDTQQELSNLQRVLGLPDPEVALIQAKLIRQREVEQANSSVSLPPKAVQPDRALPIPPRHPRVRFKPPPIRLPRTSDLLIAAGIGAILISGTGGWFYLRWRMDQTVQAALETAERQKAAAAYDSCIAEAKVIPANSRFYPAAQRLLNDCHTGLTAAQLAEAKALAASRKFKEAIALAAQIPSTSSAHAAAQALIQQWSTALLQLATRLYQQDGKLNEALAVAKAIPMDSSSGQQAQQLVAQWPKDWAANQANFQQAQREFNQNDWTATITAAKKITSTPYWQQKIQPLLQQAEAKLAAANQPAQPAPAAQVSSEPAPDWSSYEEQVPYAPPASTPRITEPSPRATFTPEPMPTVTFTPEPMPTN